MRIRFTSIVWEDVGAIVNKALVALEKSVDMHWQDHDYGGGIDTFLAVLVAIDEADNSRFAIPHNRVGYVADAEGSRFKQISIAVEMLPADLIDREIPEISQLFVDGLLRRLARPGIKLPKQFDWEAFTQNLTVALTSRTRP